VLPALFAGLAGAGGERGDERAALVDLARRVDLLEKRHALAASDSFYLLLDPAQSKLQLMLRGALLRDYTVLGLEVGAPRVAFRSRNLVTDWQGRIWQQGHLDPARDRERLEVLAPPDTVAADSVKSIVPPTPEEAYPVPHRYHVRYAGGLSLEVRPRELDDSLPFLSRATSLLRVWYRDFRAAVRSEPEDRVRLRMVMRPEDAASLYRALPPETRLLVLPPST
jgi:hypothetical protein